MGIFRYALKNSSFGFKLWFDAKNGEWLNFKMMWNFVNFDKHWPFFTHWTFWIIILIEAFSMNIVPNRFKFSIILTSLRCILSSAWVFFHRLYRKRHKAQSWRKIWFQSWQSRKVTRLTINHMEGCLYSLKTLAIPLLSFNSNSSPPLHWACVNSNFSEILLLKTSLSSSKRATYLVKCTELSKLLMGSANPGALNFMRK